MRVLVVEDEPVLGEHLLSQLRERGFAADLARDGEEGRYYLDEYPSDLAIIDIGLPKLSGIDLIREARTSGKQLPILILTARGNWQDKVEGLEAGADDYLVKPFHIEELMARLNALLRRRAGLSTPLITWGSIAVNTATQSVTLAGAAVTLTAYEYKVLEYLLLKRGTLVTKSELTEHIYDQDFDRDSNVLEVFIGRLRRKLDPEGTLNPIETLRGRGYRFRPEPPDG